MKAQTAEIAASVYISVGEGEPINVGTANITVPIELKLRGAEDGSAKVVARADTTEVQKALGVLLVQAAHAVLASDTKVETCL